MSKQPDLPYVGQITKYFEKSAPKQIRKAIEKAGKGDIPLLWAGEAGALAREEDAGALTRRLWDEALACAGRLGQAMGV